jgi:hypothetical protein
MKNRFSQVSQKRAQQKVRPLRVPSAGVGPWTAPLQRIPVAFASSTSVQGRSASTVQPFNASTSSAPGVTLANVHGFWELTFANQHAVLPQSLALFHIAFLLANPSTEPLNPNQLEAAVCQEYEDHPDFLKLLPSVWLKRERAEILKLLSRREDCLYQIMESMDELDPVRQEALAQLLDIQDQQESILALNAQNSTLGSILQSIIGLYNRLALALDARGNPHPVIRPFARHLLLYLIMPTIKASRGLDVPRFTYQPPSAP